MPVEIVEGVFVDVIEIARAGAQGAIIGEVAVGERDEPAFAGFQRIGQIAVVIIAMPNEALLRRETAPCAPSAPRPG